MLFTKWLLPLAAVALHSFGQAPAPRAPLHVLEHLANGLVTSDNWSGYAVTGEDGSVSSVTGSWIVPAVNCEGTNPPIGAASFWIGIDGYTTATVEQTGTDSDCSSGSPLYYAWYEFFPDPGIAITTIAVQPGDVIAASVTYNGAAFTATITDQRTQESFTKSKAVPAAKRSSAEWIGESPAGPLPDYGLVFFGQDETGFAGTCDATLNSKTRSIGGFPGLTVHPITMVSSSGMTEAVPGSLSADGSSFSIEWH
jgi:hypothetical protein